MADIALVHLAIDSSGVAKGEKDATRHLQQVESAMSQTEKRAATFNTAINSNLSKSGAAFRGLSDSATRAGSALSGLGGPLGRLGGELQGTVSQMQGLHSSFGLVGGAAIGAVAAVGALSAALVKLTLSGVEVSDQLTDIAEETGLTIGTVTRLAAAYRLSGEDIGGLSRAFKTFQSAVVDAKDATTPAAQALARIGTDSKKAGADIEGAFIKGALQVKQLRQTVEGAEATNLLYGKGVGALVRQQDNFNLVLGQSQKALEESFVIPTQAAIEAGGRLDAKIKGLSNSWTVFQQNLSTTSAGKSVENTVDGMSGSLGVLHNTLAGIDGLVAKSKWLQGLLFFGTQMSNPIALLREIDYSTPSAGTTAPGRAALINAQVRTFPTLPKGKATKEALKPITEFTAEQIGDPFRKGLELAEKQAQATAASIEAAAIKEAIFQSDRLEYLSILSGRQEKLALGPSPLQEDFAAALAGQPIPGGEIFKGLPKGRLESAARLDAEFGAIFDDFLFTILTAQGTLGDAFKGLATGILDTFAREMIASMQQSFIQPLAKGLTDMLQDALGGIFDGVGGGTGSAKGFFGGIFKGIGKIFGGIFGGGGTLGPGKFGIAGERGPELIFSGSQPMHIAPVTAGSAGNVFTINVGVNAPSGSVDRRTQDQLAVTVMNAVKRAQRNEGAR